ncbi:MBL fold metallo-hydrolase [uncultured Helicobacter sp.]|uniref:MBL fold metallo-hydrolase n=1 Tax=uncultured Helicobacter sp. TaxID=175537 RepID=UPI002610AE94|nr:MBL fold metallo-hydrolase [uncultured Helicobacter sp.]
MLKLFSFIIGLCAFITCEAAQKANIYHQKIANSDIYIISLQEKDMNKDILLPQNEKEKQLIQEAKVQPNQHNVVLIKNPQFIALVDSGFPHTQDILKASLASLGVSYKDINYLIISHAHGDHIGGILNERGENNFPNATLLIDEKEFAYWQKQDNQRTKDSLNLFTKKAFFNHKKAILSNTLEILAVPAYGHTPGHNFILMRPSDKKAQQDMAQSLVFWADMLHIYDIQSQNPQISAVYDVNPTLAAQVRAKFLKQFKSEKIPVVGAHTPFTKPVVLE